MSRKRKFQLLTQVRKDGEEMCVFKCAENIEAQEFLNHIYQMYEILNKSKIPFKVNRILEKKDTCLKFKFVQGSLWLSDLEDMASRDSLNTFISELEKFQNLLEKFPSENNTLSSDFINIFGDFHKKQNYRLLYPGVLDLNFDNIIKDKKGNLHLIDYEWTFNFAIPTRYILYRSIFNIFIELRYLQNKDITLETIENHFQFTLDEIKTYLKWEENFQRYVSKEDPLRIDLLSTRELLLRNTEFPKDPIWKKEEKETLEEELKTTQEELKTTQEELKTAQEELKTAQEELKTTQEELKTTQEELKTTQEEFKTTQEELKTTQEELKTTQEELKTTQEELKVSQEINKIKENELQNIYSSKSWKLTQPIREFAKIMIDFKTKFFKKDAKQKKP